MIFGYEYPDTSKMTYEEIQEWVKNMDSNVLQELNNALNHDTVLYNCYKNYQLKWRIEDPFSSINFLRYLSFVALATHQKVWKQYLKHINTTVNPPIFILPKDIKLTVGAVNAAANAAQLRKVPWLIKLIKWWRGKSW